MRPRLSEEPRPQAGASSKEKDLGAAAPKPPAGHSSPATSRVILAFSRDWLWGGAAGGAGAIWGLALARFLALEVRWPFFLGWWGAALAMLLAGGAAFLLWWALVPRYSSPGAAALRLTPLLLPLVDLLLGPPQPWRGAALLLGGLAVAAVAYLRPSLSPWVCFLLAVGLPLALYLPDVAPWVGRADTFEFQVVAPRLGVAHPSGYPLYILLGKLFSLLPVGAVAWRVNLSSAVCASLAAGFLFLALKEFAVCDEIALLAAFTLAFSPTLWPRAVEAEVYGLNALLAALSLWVAARWKQGRLCAERALPLLGLLAGVGIASHLTLGALLLIVVTLAWKARPRLSLRTLATAAALFVVGVALYLYIPLRWPSVNDGEVMTVAHFWSFVTNAESGGAFHALALVRDPARWGVVFRLLRMQVGWGGLALAAVGLVALFKRSWALALGTALACAAWLWFNLSFYVAEPDYSAFLVPAHVTIILWLGLGLGWLFDLLRRRAAALLPLALLAVALLPLSRLWLTGPLLDTDREQADDAWGRFVMGLPLDPGAAILADSEKFPPLYYLQQVQGLRPDLDLVMRFHEEGYREELAARLNAGQTVYLARFLPRLESYFLRSLGPLVEVGTGPLEEPPPDAVPVDALFGREAALLAFDLRSGRKVGPSHHLTLYWRAAVDLQDDLEVRLRLVDGVGREVWASDGARPVGGQYPTNAWPPGAVVPDYHALSPPPWLPPGEYGLEAALFPRFGDAGLALESGMEWLALDRLEVAAPPVSTAPLPNERSYAFAGGAWLVGFDVAGETAAAAPVAVDLAWRGIEGGEEVRLAWADARGREVKAEPFSLAAGALRSRHLIDAPRAPGEYTLRAALAGRKARCGWLAPPTDGCALAELAVSPAPEGLANFADLITLLEAEVGRAEAQPGQIVPVTLRWRALRKIDEDYTAFVHLVGPDGRLHGQADAWPVQGTRPTSGWAPGEELSDPYEVRLAADGPPGRYQVRVGWYLLATMRRLPVVDLEGRPVGDSFAVGEFSVGD